MKVFLKIIAAVIVIILFFAIIGSVGGENKEEIKTEISKRHCELEWDKASDSTKEIVLNEFIENDGIDPLEGSFKSPGMLAAELLPKHVKYPNTIIIDDKPFESWIYFNSGSIESLKDGTVSFSKNFTAENKMSMIVKGSLLMTVKYQAGCKNFQLLDFIVE